MLRLVRVVETRVEGDALAQARGTRLATAAGYGTGASIRLALASPLGLARARARTFAFDLGLGLACPYALALALAGVCTLDCAGARGAAFVRAGAAVPQEDGFRGKVLGFERRVLGRSVGAWRDVLCRRVPVGRCGLGGRGQVGRATDQGDRAASEVRRRAFPRGSVERGARATC